MPKHSEVITDMVRRARSACNAREKYLRETMDFYSAKMREGRDPASAYGPVCNFMMERARKDLATLEESRQRINALGRDYHEQAQTMKTADIEFLETELRDWGIT